MVGGLAGNGMEPFFSAEPTFLTLGILTGGCGNFLGALVEGGLTGEVGLDFPDADGLGGGGRDLGELGDFLKGPLAEHLLGAEGDALVEGGAFPLEEDSA